MFGKILVTLICVITAILIASAQTTIPGGYVSGTWEESGSPYLIEGEVTVHSDSTLNIEPGVEVNFNGFALASGVYIYRLSMGNFTQRGK